MSSRTPLDPHLTPDTDAGAPAAPRAPTRDAWEAMNPAERSRVIERLGPMPDGERFAPESDWHIDAVRAGEDALEAYFRKRGRGAYIGRGITVYYPDERRFAPDLFVVLDAERHPRSVWNVLVEGRGLDVALEVHWGGDKRKDTELNVARFARMGIPEYFVFDARRVILHGWRLEIPGDRTYTRIVPQAGRWPVRTLGLELGVRDGLPRWYDGVGVVPLTRELNIELVRSVDEALERARQFEAERDALAAAAAESARQFEAERDALAAAAAESARRAAEAEAEMERLRAELTRLRGEVE